MNTLKKSRKSLRYITKIAILSACSALLMFFEIPLPFAPSFYKLDFSESVVLMGAFAMGPVSGILMEMIKNLIKILIMGTHTAYVGEFANFITGCAFVIPAAIIYKYNKSKKGAAGGMAVGTLVLTIIGAVINYFVLIPAFSEIYGLPLEQIVSMGTAVNSSITDLKTLIVFAVAPFNIVKGIICSLIAFILYKKISKILHF